MENLEEIKKHIENNPVAFATTTNDNNPNVIGVAFVKVVSDNKILITDNYMNQTIKDILNNPNVCLVVWDKDFVGYKLIGKAQYFTSGEWLASVKKMKENEGVPAKGAVLIEISKIISSK